MQNKLIKISKIRSNSADYFLLVKIIDIEQIKSYQQSYNKVLRYAKIMCGDNTGIITVIV